MKTARDIGRGFEAMLRKAKHLLMDGAHGRSIFTIRRWRSQEEHDSGQTPYLTTKFFPNVFLNEGINELFTLICSSGGTKFDNTNARIGVGTIATGEDPVQTGLLGTTAFKAMDNGYPTYGTSQKATFRSTFGTDEGNIAWNEFTVDNGAAAGKNWNRKVSAQGTKVAGQVWELTIELSIS